KDRRVVLYGQARIDSYRFPSLCLLNPEFEIVEDESDDILHIGRVVPVYRKVGEITPKSLRRILYTALEDLEEEVPDTLPDYLVEKYRLMPKHQALIDIHFPTVAESDPAARSQAMERLDAQQSPAHYRLIFEEFFQLQVGLIHRKRGRSHEVKQRVYR